MEMNEMDALFRKVLSKHMPSKEEYSKIEKEIDAFLSKISASLADQGIRAEAMLGGSAAKGTFIKGDFDVDVFVRFDYSYASTNLSAMLEKALDHLESGNKRLKFTRVHGSRDYFQAKIEGLEIGTLEFEIIPVLNVNDPKKALNVTDMSPLHVIWLSKRMTPQLRKEILLAKLFCKAQGVYGAESYINGFSGHVLDILIANYNSFLELLKASQSWKPYQVIDVEKYGTAGKLNSSKVSQLIVIDPILPERNAAAALSREKIDMFVEKASEFLKMPSEDYFVKKEFTLEDMKQQKKKLDAASLLVLKVVSLEGKQDIVGAKLLKAYIHILKHLKISEFSVLSSGWTWDKRMNAEFWYIVKEKMLSEEFERMGPPANTKAAAESFKKVHNNAYTRQNRLYAMVKRQFRTPEELVRHLLKEPYVAEKMKGAKLKLL